MASSTSSDDLFDAATTYVGSLAAHGDVSENDLLKFYGFTGSLITKSVTTIINTP